jgi:hypothetical protein
MTPLHGRDWFVRKVRELGDALAALPQERREQFASTLLRERNTPAGTIRPDTPQPRNDDGTRDT